MTVADEIRRAYDLLAAQPGPRFNRIRVGDLALFAGLPRRKSSATFGPHDLGRAVFGIPVVEDPDVEANVIELWLGDELVERIHVA